MDNELKDFIQKGRQLLQKVSNQNDSKRKILILRANKNLDSIEIILNKLIP
jgi:hypothetical protein